MGDPRFETQKWRKLRLVPGAAPGEWQADPAGLETKVSAIQYTEERVTEREIFDIEDVKELHGKNGKLWLNVTGLGNATILRDLAQLFNIHHLALEDVVNVPQRPKAEEYDEHLFVIVQMLTMDDTEVEREQLSMYLGTDFLITFQETPDDPLEPVRDRLRQGTGRLRNGDPDYLAYTLIDAVTDHYFPLLEAFQDRVELLEDKLLGHTDNALWHIRRARSDLVTIRRAVVPMREVTRALMASEMEHMSESTMVYLRDCHDHALEAGELIDSCREIVGGLMDVHLSTQSNQVNQTMRVLTVIATLFMPLSFIAGVYGMNFDPSLPGNMPELTLPFGYPVALGAMGVVAVGLLFFFRRRGWL
ncbi:MAG: magnesium/cobalt transporter CorA [Thermoanaerobaculia bacterium]|nr:magnesium/cobalt transporter CorA [Thermoanaerobaculia bacterium]